MKIPIHLSHSVCDVALLSSDEYEECFVDIESPYGPVLRITDEHRDGKLICQVLDPATETVLAHATVELIRSLLRQAEEALRVDGASD